MKLIFLDIDGVLNDHSFNYESQSLSLKSECIWCFNQILNNINVSVVLSSAWRYMIHGGDISLKGFEYLLRTHGVSSKINIIGVTVLDELIQNRVDQIQYFIENCKHIEKYVVLDDIDFGWKSNFYKTNPYLGLQRKDIDPIIGMLR